MWDSVTTCQKMVESMSVSISQENCQVKFQTMSWCQDTRRYVDWHLPCQIKFPNGCQSQCQKKNKSNVRLFVRVYVWMYVRRCVTWKIARAIVRIHIRMYVTHEICQIKCKSKCQSWCHFLPEQTSKQMSDYMSSCNLKNMGHMPRKKGLIIQLIMT